MAAGRDEENQNHVQTIYDYDVYGRVVAQRRQGVGFFNREIFRDPNNANREEVVAPPNGGVVRFYYDNRGRHIQETRTEDDGNIITINY